MLKKLLLASAGVFGFCLPAFAQQPGCTTLSLTVGCYVYPQGILQVPQILPNGSATTPSLAWQNAPATGLFWNPATGGIDWTFAGTLLGEMSSNGMNSIPIGTITPKNGYFLQLGASQRLYPPTWHTAGRPTSPTTGEQGWNLDISSVEWWNGTAWVQPSTAAQAHAAAVFSWSSNVTVAAGTYTAILSWPWSTGTIQSVSYATGGSSPSFTGQVLIDSTPVTSCSAITVTSSAAATTACTAANTLTSTHKLSVVISAVSGTPQSATFQVNYVHSEP